MARVMTTYNYSKGKIPIGNGLASDTRGVSFHDTITQTGAGTSDYVLVPDSARSVLCLMDPNGNNAKLQASCGSTDELAAGSGIWEDWDHGLVNSITSFIYGPVTAIRLVVNAGGAESKVQIRATLQ